MDWRLVRIFFLSIGCAASTVPDESPECRAAGAMCAGQSYVVIERDGLLQSSCFEADGLVARPESGGHLVVGISAEAGASPTDAGLCDVSLELHGIEIEPASGTFVPTVEDARASVPSAWFAVVNAPCAVNADVASTVLGGTWLVESTGSDAGDEVRARVDDVVVRWDDGREATVRCAFYGGPVRVVGEP
jgi:hypothetical protein